MSEVTPESAVLSGFKAGFRTSPGHRATADHIAGRREAFIRNHPVTIIGYGAGGWNHVARPGIRERQRGHSLGDEEHAGGSEQGGADG